MRTATICLLLAGVALSVSAGFMAGRWNTESRVEALERSVFGTNSLMDGRIGNLQIDVQKLSDRISDLRATARNLPGQDEADNLQRQIDILDNERKLLIQRVQALQFQVGVLQQAANEPVGPVADQDEGT